MNRIAYLVLAIGGAVFSPAAGQKFEMERRIKTEALPVVASEFLNTRFPGIGKYKCYQEQSDQGLSFEAKFRRNGARYSVEFDAEGRHLETERQIRRRQLPEEVSGRIDEALEQTFHRSRIIKVQERLEGDRVTGYEIEVKGKTDSHLGHFELQFGPEGRIREVRTIVDPPNQFLFY